MDEPIPLATDAPDVAALGGPETDSIGDIAPAAASLDKAIIVKIVNEARERSNTARRERRDKNRRNWDFVNSKQDWSHKLPGQSRIALPDLPMAIEQASATIENHLVNFSNWFSVETLGGLSIFDPDTVRLLVQHVLERLWDTGNSVETSLKFPTLLGDSIKLGLVESEVCWKIFSVDSERCVYMLESSDPERPAGILGEPPANEEASPRTYERLSYTVRRATLRTSRVAIELVPYEDFFPDPSPLKQYEIHVVRRHISELRNNPDYDPEAIERIRGRAVEMEREQDKQRRAGTSTRTPTDPWEVEVMEYWGNLIDWNTGEVYATNQLVTVAAGEVLRYPTPNPFWHGFSPFVRTALLRTPKAPVHNALVDRAVPVAEAENETIALMVDGGLNSVLGIRQVRPEILDNPASIANGIGAGFTAILKKNVPPGVNFMERVDEGTNIPAYAVEMLSRLSAARQTALATTALGLGQTAPRQIKATEAVIADEASSNLFESIATRIEETLIEPALQLLWMTLWQTLDDFSSPELVQILGPQRATILRSLSGEERFVLMANNVKFKVRGLRNLLSRVKDFQKINTVLSSIAQSPTLSMAWDAKYSTIRLLEMMVRAVNLDPTELEKREGEGPELDPTLLTGGAPAAGGVPPGGAIPGDVGQPPMEAAMAPPNPTGFRGSQV